MNEYQEKITEIYTKYPKHAVKMIFSNDELKNWIENNCDPNSPNNLTKIYTAYHNELLACPCGSGKLRRCKRFNKRLYSCGTIKCCSYAKELQEINRVNGSLKKYGCKNPMQSTEVKNNLNASVFIKYKVSNISQCQFIKDKKEQTSLKNNGVEYLIADPTFRKKSEQKLKDRYGIIHPSQMKYSQEVKNILFNKTNLKTFLLKNGFNNGCKILGISLDTLYRAHDILELDISKKNSSSYESEIENWLNNNNIIFESNTRKIISPLELDFYLPKYKIAIEFDGLYWHSEGNGKDRTYHFNKTKLCKEAGIRLIHIFEDEWLHKKDICLDILSRIFNINQIRFMARKCDIREFSNKECKDFCNNNHLQGYVPSSINLGLTYDGEILQLLTLRHSRYNKKVEWEIIRQVNKKGYQITGGLQKLWTYFLKTYNPTSVVSYCDRRWFLGESYLKLKFTLNHTTSPQYWYIKHNTMERMNRMSFQKKKCIELGKDFEKLEILNKMSENQITKNILHLDRIWDCGQDTWIWQN